MSFFSLQNSCIQINCETNSVQWFLFRNRIQSLPFHRLSIVLSKINYTKTPLVTRVFDPFRASFVAPDHALESLIQNAHNLVYRSIPSQVLSTAWETNIVLLLRLYGWHAQESIFDARSYRLLSMKISHIYDVISVSMLATLFFLCANRDHLLRQFEHAHTFLLSTVRVVVTFSREWSYFNVESDLMWFLRHEKARIVASQREFLEYLAQVRVVCSDVPYRDGDENTDSNSCFAMAAKQMIDKRYVHRIFELAFKLFRCMFMAHDLLSYLSKELI